MSQKPTPVKVTVVPEIVQGDAPVEYETIAPLLEVATALKVVP
jgi:hypothetical protein